MGSNFKKLTDLVKNSELNPEERAEFLNLFAKASDQDLDVVIKLFTDEPGWIKKIFDNYQKKKKVLTENDRVGWQEILRQECEDLEKINS